MQNFYFTCGQSHSHKITGNVVWDKDSVLKVVATDEETARDKVFRMFGPKWSMCYTEETISMEYYPKGICYTINA
jgi:glutathionyl-hydroquinone reductase